MDGKVDVTTSGVHSPARVAQSQAVGATRPHEGSTSRADAPERHQGIDARVPSFRPTPEEIPPNWVFAPGFLHADRRGLVPYPGVDLPDGIVSSVLLKRYLEETADRTADAARVAYGAAATVEDPTAPVAPPD